MAPLVTFAVLVSASIVSGAALYVARKAAQIAEKIDEADERSRQNRQYLMGDPPTGQSIIERVSDLEDAIDD